MTAAAWLALLALPAVAAGAGTPAALVGGEPITLAAVDEACGTPCARLLADVRERKWAMLETLVGEALLAGRPPSPPPAVADADVEAYLAAHAEDFHGPPDRDRAAVRFFLARERRRADEAARIAEQRAARPPRTYVAESDPTLADDGAPDRLLASAGERAVRDHDVEQRLALVLYRLRGELARERRRVLEPLVAERLWADEARARGTSVAALRAEVAAHTPPVTDADVDAYFTREVLARDPGATRRPDRLRPYLEFRAARATEDAFLETLRDRRAVVVLLSEPEPPRLALGPGAGGWQGPRDASVRLVFLTGYRGETSHAMWPVVRALAAAPRTALTVRAFLPLWDPEATAVAAAARCAAAGGRFWAFHDAAARATPLPDGATLERLARAVGLEPRAVAACAARPETLAAVAAESAEAERLGLGAPPAVLIDGRVFGGMQQEAALRAALEAARRKKNPDSRHGVTPSRR